MLGSRHERRPNVRLIVLGNGPRHAIGLGPWIPERILEIYQCPPDNNGLDLNDPCSAFTRVAACTLARSPIRDPLSEGFRHFVSSMPAPGASRGSEAPGGACTHWKAPPSHGAPPYRPLDELALRELASSPSLEWGGERARDRHRAATDRRPEAPGRIAPVVLSRASIGSLGGAVAERAQSVISRALCSVWLRAPPAPA